MERFVGQEIKFDCQPYDRGRGRIKSVEVASEGMWKGYALIELEVLEGSQRSRIGGHFIDSPIAPGSTRRMYHYSEAQLQRAVDGETLIYVYPV